MSGCNNCDPCQGCNRIAIPATGAQLCPCLGCNAATPPGCNNCDPCQGCQGCNNCDPCQGCNNCDPCLGPATAGPCQGGCDACDGCQRCDPCQDCNNLTRVRGAITVTRARAARAPAMHACNPCLGCNNCDPCQGFNSVIRPAWPVIPARLSMVATRPAKAAIRPARPAIPVGAATPATSAMAAIIATRAKGARVGQLRSVRSGVRSLRRWRSLPRPRLAIVARGSCLNPITGSDLRWTHTASPSSNAWGADGCPWRNGGRQLLPPISKRRDGGRPESLPRGKRSVSRGHVASHSPRSPAK